MEFWNFRCVPSLFLVIFFQIVQIIQGAQIIPQEVQRQLLTFQGLVKKRENAKNSVWMKKLQLFTFLKNCKMVRWLQITIFVVTWLVEFDPARGKVWLTMVYRGFDTLVNRISILRFLNQDYLNEGCLLSVITVVSLTLI